MVPPDFGEAADVVALGGGNVTTEGITKDLEWMKRVGIGGFQLCDVSSGGGQVVEKKIEFMSEPWLGAVRHSAAEADRLGLEMSIFSSAGWSETGGRVGEAGTGDEEGGVERGGGDGAGGVS